MYRKMVLTLLACWIIFRQTEVVLIFRFLMYNEPSQFERVFCIEKGWIGRKGSNHFVP